MDREARANVRERFAPADGAARDTWPKDEDGHMLAGVVGAAPGWIIAMIGGDDGGIARPRRGEEFGESGVECLKAMGIASNVAAVAEIRVEIEEIGENQTAVRKLRQGIERRIEMRPIVRALDLLAGKTMRENIANLADRHDRSRRGREPFQKIAGRRGKPKILAVGGAGEAVPRVAGKGRAITRPMLRGLHKRRAIRQRS